MGSEWHELGTAISSPTYEREGEVKYIGAAVRLVPCQSFYIYIYIQGYCKGYCKFF